MPPLHSLGVFGGSFNPVHSGHILLARHAKTALKLDAVWFVPCFRSADGKALAPPALRLKWLNLALDGEEGLEACDMELRRGGLSRTVDTLRALRESYGPALRLTLLLGQDQARRFSTWKEADRIPGLARLAVFRRPGVEAGPKDLRARTLQAPLFDVSSSGIRALIRRRRAVSLLLPPALAENAELLRFYGGRTAAEARRLALGRGKGYHALPSKPAGRR